MSNSWVVLKYGGSSVRGLSQWQAIQARVRECLAEGHRVLLVCSAVQGVTDLLHTIAANRADEALHNELLTRHGNLAEELGVSGKWVDELRNRLGTALKQLAESSAPSNLAELLALGEWASTRIGAEYLNQTLATDWVDAADFLEVIPEPHISKRRQWFSAWCQPRRDDSTVERLAACQQVVMTQGYIARMPGNGIALLGRGGSDISAALLGGRIGAERVEIWTDVPGLFSGDPRVLPDARLICELDYSEALELAASGAHVIHPRSIRAASEVNLPMWIMDSARPRLGGTRIFAEGGDKAPGAKAVVCQDSMAVILMENINARQHVGFLAQVFDVFAQRGISIDLVATSETTTTVALNLETNHMNAEDLDSLADGLKPYCRFRVYGDCVCMNIVGKGVGSSLSRFARTMKFFETTALLMVSHSANDMCLSLLVEGGHEQELLSAAHADLMEGGPPSSAFGPSWTELQDVGRDG